LIFKKTIRVYRGEQEQTNRQTSHTNFLVIDTLLKKIEFSKTQQTNGSEKRDKQTKQTNKMPTTMITGYYTCPECDYSISGSIKKCGMLRKLHEKKCVPIKGHQDKQMERFQQNIKAKARACSREGKSWIGVNEDTNTKNTIGNVKLYTQTQRYAPKNWGKERVILEKITKKMKDQGLALHGDYE
jgi:hypothetical protein